MNNSTVLCFVLFFTAALAIGIFQVFQGQDTNQDSFLTCQCTEDHTMCICNGKAYTISSKTEIAGDVGSLPEMTLLDLHSKEPIVGSIEKLPDANAMLENMEKMNSVERLLIE